jgi:hypothetical protein
MRNTLILAVLCLGLYSCDKEYTCECNTVSGNDSTQFKTEFTTRAYKENQAKQQCTDYQEKLRTSLGMDVACGLK